VIIESKEKNSHVTKSMVSDFPISFKLITNSEYDSFMEMTDYGAEDSSQHYKISGKKWAKALYKMQIKPEKDPDKYGNFYLTSFKPDDYQDAVDNCQKDYDLNALMCDEFSFEEVALYMKRREMEKRRKKRKSKNSILHKESL